MDDQGTEEAVLHSLEGGGVGMQTDHGFTINCLAACCRQSSAKGRVDCSACLEEAWTALCNSLDKNERAVAENILTLVRQGEEGGISKADLTVRRHRRYCNHPTYCLFPRGRSRLQRKLCCLQFSIEWWRQISLRCSGQGTTPLFWSLLHISQSGA